MGIVRPNQLTARLIGAFVLGTGVVLCPKAPFAAKHDDL